MSARSPPKLQPKNQSSPPPTKTLQQADNDFSDPGSDSEQAQPTGGRKSNSNALQQQNQQLQQQIAALQQQQQLTASQQQAPKPTGGRAPVVRNSRILDRPVKEGQKDSSLKIKIELDLEVEVDLYARVKGDVCIGLM